jgi:CheY-like chemotaxis protein/anti-sigma regulatory factor (Ser/Thr protein kinase)
MATVLVVDDSAMYRKLAGELVGKTGSQAIFAEDGRQALEILDREHPDAVLTDLQMPHVDGLQLVEEVRKRRLAIPVIIMTAFGSEEIARQALRAGAASYVPKKVLATELNEALRTAYAAARTKRELQRARDFLKYQEAYFVLGYDSDASAALVSALQENLAQMDFGDEVALLQVGMAITEALANARDHGNLELDSALREESDDAYYNLGIERQTQAPYADRRVHLTEHLTPTEVRYTIRDEGNGFDSSSLPDPTNPENLLVASGRGIMLIHTFMDEVSFNDCGNEITMLKRRIAD